MFLYCLNGYSESLRIKIYKEEKEHFHNVLCDNAIWTQYNILKTHKLKCNYLNHVSNLIFPHQPWNPLSGEAVVRRCPVKKVFLETSQNSLSLLFNKVAGSVTFHSDFSYILFQKNILELLSYCYFYYKKW